MKSSRVKRFKEDRCYDWIDIFLCEQYLMLKSEIANEPYCASIFNSVEALIAGLCLLANLFPGVLFIKHGRLSQSVHIEARFQVLTPTFVRIFGHRADYSDTTFDKDSLITLVLLELSILGSLWGFSTLLL